MLDFNKIHFESIDSTSTYALENIRETEDTYEIKDGKLVISVLDRGGKTTELKYSVEGNKLTIDGQDYTKQ